MADGQIPPIDPNLTNETSQPVETSPEPQSVISEDPPIPPNPPDIPDPSAPSNPPDPSAPSASSPPTELAPVPEPVPAPNPKPEPKPSPQLNVPDLSFPFYGSVSPSLTFNQIPDNERIKQKFQEWGIVGHNGLDFPLSEGTEVLACDSGKVIQAGDNGDYGVCVILQHPWGQSIYAHFKETKVIVDREVKTAEIIGLSGQTGSAFGPHLHFAIKPNNPDESNGYLGFIDPAPYLKNITPKPKVPSPEPSISIPSSPPSPSVPPVPVEPEIKTEPSLEIPKIPETPEVPEIPESPQVPQNPQIFTPRSPSEVGPQISEEEIQKQVSEKLTLELESRRQKANEARKENREEHLAAIEKFLGQKSEITNQDVRDLVHVSQTTATEYLSSLVKSGRIKVEGKGKATVYKNIFS